MNIIHEQGKKLQLGAFAVISREIFTLVPVNTSPEKKKRCCCKREGKLQISATALKPLTTKVNNVDYMAQCPLSRGGRYTQHVNGPFLNVMCRK